MATPTRQQQELSLLSRVPSAARRADGVFDVGLRLVTGQVLTLRVELPPAFPDAPPTLRVVDAGATHPWLDAFGRVVGLSQLYSWNARTSWLGDAVSTALSEFCVHPPRIAASTSSNAGATPTSTNNYNGSAQARLPPTMPSSTPSSSGGPPPPTRTSTTTPPRPTTTFNNGGGGGGGNAPSTAAATPPDDLHIELPPIPTEFNELDAMDAKELQALLDNDRRLGEFFQQLAVVKNVSQLLQAVKESNLESAMTNLSRKEELDAARRRVEELREKVVAARRDLQALTAAQAASQPDPAKLAADLERLATETDEKCEDAAALFRSAPGSNGTDDDADLDAAVARFRQLRTLYHLRMAKAERLRASVQLGSSSR